MKVTLQPHLKLRLKQREIPKNYPDKILSQPESHYYDSVRNHRIAVKKLKYYGKIRPMVVAYDIIDIEVQVITVYPTTNQEISNRLKSGRWVKSEKN